MRSDWQTHCRVITVWWTFIVFRLVETETCCALACCTNANLFHVDIISHCLLSNHNTCLTFLYNENVLPGVYYILARRKQKKGDKKGEETEVKSLIIIIIIIPHDAKILKLFDIYVFNITCEVNGRDKHLESAVVITCLIYHKEKTGILFLQCLAHSNAM